MNHFFVNINQVQGKRIRIMGEDAHHIRDVLRLHPGDEVSVAIAEEEQASPAAAETSPEEIPSIWQTAAKQEKPGKPWERHLPGGNGTSAWGAAKGSTQIGARDYRHAELRCGIVSFGEADVWLEVRFVKPLDAELPVKITLYQSLPKADKMDLIVQKAVELGAWRIVPMAAKRCVMKWEESKAERKRERLAQIAKSAAEQAKRGLIPTVSAPMSFQEALLDAMKLGKILFPYELAGGMGKTREIFSKLHNEKHIGLFIGPEGGFADEEVRSAMDAGANVITLGKRILRTETAGLYVLSVLGYLFEE
ncbi:MAG: 16S rRNA (uracil(1498)-N(3))-methyltransferase [Lachnospiraceae bacterium]|nr:16S rRNA (uracil(1498)-N(3))-methyltransferase [Lachnospiraceae bacterium]